ncbi:unnamed protein product [Hermetia illucens]|uniref:Chitin-binding type-2 domain-containing protein n=1 Tax=Hermetia illucens TaxID=343691 RepID=A0A7R8UGI4_HERIL|nr:uncharacterized protein LOC119648879 [Hermetia illucens]CAD7080447.1 unnamed protein product [Hermetia illucens]
MYKAIIPFSLWVVFLTPHACQESPITCFGFPDGKTYAKPGTDNEFYICAAGIPVSQKCKDGLIFYPSEGYCAKEQGSVVTPPPVGPNVCENQVDGTLYPSPSGGSDYIMCKNNQMVVQKCQNNYVFDEAYGGCVENKCSK